MTVVAAAGNDSGSAAARVPAAYNEVITVSALADTDGKPGGLGGHRCYSWGTYDEDDTYADFSNRGSDVDLIAPGKCIWSTIPSGYAYMSGTSMAAPHVTGAVALLKSGRPYRRPAEVKEALQYLGTYDWKTSTDPDGNPDKLLDVSRIGPRGDFSVSAGPDVHDRRGRRTSPLPDHGHPQRDLVRAGRAVRRRVAHGGDGVLLAVECLRLRRSRLDPDDRDAVRDRRRVLSDHGHRQRARQHPRRVGHRRRRRRHPDRPAAGRRRPGQGDARHDHAADPDQLARRDRSDDRDRGLRAPDQRRRRDLDRDCCHRRDRPQRHRQPGSRPPLPVPGPGPGRRRKLERRGPAARVSRASCSRTGPARSPTPAPGRRTPTSTRRADATTWAVAGRRLGPDDLQRSRRSRSSPRRARPAARPRSTSTASSARRSASGARAVTAAR